MGCANTLRQFFKKFDLFKSQVFLRYRGDPEYSTASGGVCSLILIIAFMIVFTNLTIGTITKQNIEATLMYLEEDDPSLLETTTADRSTFFFAIGLQNIDLNHPNITYFDLTMHARGNNQPKTRQMVLSQCQKESWELYSEDIGRSFDRLNFSQWLCPSKSQQIELQGKFTSDIFKYIKVSVKACSTPNPGTTCANSSELDQSQFVLNFYFINTLLNPHEQEHRGIFLDDKHFYPFTLTFGSESNLYVSSYTIQTDQSIFPFEDIQVQKGGIVLRESAETFPRFVIDQEYLALFIRKSSLSLVIERSFTKVDDTLSYIGGLFSALLAMMIIMQAYTELSYEMQIGMSLYRYDDTDDQVFHRFHFLRFMQYMLYSFLDMINCKPQWERMDKCERIFEATRQELDVGFLMERINYHERALTVLLDDHQAHGLHLQDKLTFDECEEIHERYRLLKKYDKQCSLKKEKKHDMNETEAEMKEQKHESFEEDLRKKMDGLSKGDDLSKVEEISKQTEEVDKEENQNHIETEVFEAVDQLKEDTREYRLNPTDYQLKNSYKIYTKVNKKIRRLLRHKRIKHDVRQSASTRKSHEVLFSQRNEKQLMRKKIEEKDQSSGSDSQQ